MTIQISSKLLADSCQKKSGFIQLQSIVIRHRQPSLPSDFALNLQHYNFTSKSITASGRRKTGRFIVTVIVSP